MPEYNPDIIEVTPEPEIPISNPDPKDHLIYYKERNAALIKDYIAGIDRKTICERYDISEGRISQLVKKNRDVITISREEEKNRRLRRLKLCEMKANINIAPKDADQLVRVIEAQRKELEGDETQSTNNTQIIINNLDISGKSQAELWEMTRKLLENT